MSGIRKGTITAGEYCGWSVIVDDDRVGETGGYYLYIKKTNNLGFDYWFEAEAGVEAQLEGFAVDWGGLNLENMGGTFRKHSKKRGLSPFFLVCPHFSVFVWCQQKRVITMSLSAMIISSEKLNTEDFKEIILAHGGFVSSGKPFRGSVSEGNSEIWLALHSKDVLEEFYDAEDLQGWQDVLGGGRR